MSARKAPARVAVVVAALALLAAGLGARGADPRGTATSQAPARAPYPDHFPPGAGSDIAGRSCVLCHSAMLVTQQAKDSLGWEKTLTLMEKWGAPVTPGGHDSLRTYLLARFGARPQRR